MEPIDITIRVEVRDILAIVAALDLLVGLLKDYGHVWTYEEQGTLTAAVAACEREHLVYAVKEPG